MSIRVIKAGDCFSAHASIHCNWLHCSNKFSSKRHTHSGFHEFMYIQKGEIHHSLCGKDTILSPGSGVIIRETDVHSLITKATKSECVYVNIAFRKDILADMKRFLGYKYNIEYLEKNEEILSWKLQDFQREIFEKEIKESSDLFLATANETLIRALILRLLLKQFPPGKEKEIGHVPINGSQWFKKACISMQDKNNFLKGVRILPNIMHKSPEHISRVFQKYLHMTPSQYVNSLRINYAAWMLQTTDKTILTISLESGFNNIGYFHRLFKMNFNCTPKQYRNLKQKLIPG